VILFVDRLSLVKGSESLLLAMPSIVRPVPGACLVLVGVNELEARVRDLIDEGGLGEHVVPVFRVLPEPERILHDAAAYLCVVPSLYEPLGIVCTEAMAMGKSVVVGASDTSGFREQIVPKGPERCGAYVDPGDPCTIASAVIVLLLDREGLSRLGRNGRERVLQRFTWEYAAERTVACLPRCGDAPSSRGAVGSAGAGSDTTITVAGP